MSTAASAVTTSLPLREFLRRYGMLTVFLILFVIFAATSPPFRSSTNLVNLLQQNATFGIVACGMLVMIITGGFDLSVGASAAMSGVVAAYVITHLPTLGIPLGVAAAMASGGLAGLFNGALIALLGINPFIATLGTQILFRGLLYIATDARPVYGMPEAFTVVGIGTVGVFPVATSLFAVVALAIFLTLRFTRFGHYLYAVGGNEDASALAGINVIRVKVIAYTVGGMLAALAGIVLLGQTNIGHPSAAEQWPLTAIAIVVVGGTPLSGGAGGIMSVLLGTLILGMVGNALNLYNASPYWQPAITGLILLTSVGLERYTARSGQRGGVLAGRRTQARLGPMSRR
jgi:ribose transport system permease protein/putative xylitol transport system permease protein